MKQFLLLFITFGFNLIIAQNLVWQKQFRNFGVLNFKNTSVATNTLGEVVTVGSGLGNGGQNYIDFNPASATTNLVNFTYNIYNMWVSKLDNNGNYVWSTKFDVDAGLSQGYMRAKIDNSGNVYVAGLYKGISDFDAGAGTFTMSTTNNSGSYNTNAFFAKLNNDGTFAWAKEFKQLANTNSYSLINDIALDDNNNLILIGTYRNVDFDPSLTSLNMSNQGSFIVKLDSNGDLQYLKTFTESGINGPYPMPYALTFDNSGNILIAGSFGGIYDFDVSTTSTYTLAAGTSGSQYILKLTSNGDFVWVKAINDNINLHSNADGFVTDIATDTNNNVFVAGQTNDSLDFDPSANTYYLKSKGSTDNYIVKLDENGDFNWAKMFGGVGIESTNALTIDNNNNIYIETQFTSLDIDFDPSPVGTYTVQRMSQPSMAINQLNSNGEFVSCYYFKSTDGNAITNISDVTCNKQTNEILLSGEFRTSGSALYKVDFDPGITDAFYTSTNSSVTDVFIVKLNNTSSTGINKIKTNKSHYIVYPNPANKLLNIKTDDLLLEKTDIKILNVLGEVVLTSNINTANSQINLDNLKTGVYYLQLDNNVVQKFIKE